VEGEAEAIAQAVSGSMRYGIVLAAIATTLAVFGMKALALREEEGKSRWPVYLTIGLAVVILGVLLWWSLRRRLG